MNALAPVVSGKEVSQHRCDECRSRVWSVECARREHDVCMACAGRGAWRVQGVVHGVVQGVVQGVCEAPALLAHA